MKNPLVHTSRGLPFEKGKSGNPRGRPLGSRNRTTLAALELLEGETEALTRKAVELALNGDLQALRLCLDRVVPPSRERPVQIEMTELKSIHDARDAVAAVVAAVAAGELTLSEAAELGKLIELYIRTWEASNSVSQAEKREMNAGQQKKELKAMGLMP